MNYDSQNPGDRQPGADLPGDIVAARPIGQNSPPYQPLLSRIIGTKATSTAYRLIEEQIVTLRLPVSKAFDRASMSYYLRDDKVTFEQILLESPGIPNLSAWWTWTVFMLAFGIASFFVRRRYR